MHVENSPVFNLVMLHSFFSFVQQNDDQFGSDFISDVGRYTLPIKFGGPWGTKSRLSRGYLILLMPNGVENRINRHWNNNIY